MSKEIESKLQELNQISNYNKFIIKSLDNNHVSLFRKGVISNELKIERENITLSELSELIQKFINNLKRSK